MQMAWVFGLNQFISHGFGVFLFASLAPLMRQEIAFSNGHIAAAGALSQLSYLAGALMISGFGARVGSALLALGTGLTMTLMLFGISQLSDPIWIITALAVLSACAAISWSAIVEIISRFAEPHKCSSYLSIAASGTAWGCSFNGLMLLVILPLVGWRVGWQIAATLAACTIVVTWWLLARLDLLASKKTNSTSDINTGQGLAPRQLFHTVLFEPLARFTCLVCFSVCFSTIAFANWLNIYLAQLSLPSERGGFTWTVIGLTGMAAGIAVGKLAERFGQQLALLLICTAFAAGLTAFWVDPARFALLAGIGYGVMYFPIWGVISGWLSSSYSSTITMQISSVCMITAGLGGASGNLLVGWIGDVTGSLYLAYAMLMGNAVLLAVMATGAFLRRHRNTLSGQ